MAPLDKARSDKQDEAMRRISLLLALVAALAVAGGSSARPVSHTTSAASQPASSLCKSGYYKNVDGKCVHSPSSDPSGATAKCRDGTYSYSLHASGTCSHHGGVARWIHHP
jgi:hypothetical protein